MRRTFKALTALTAGVALLVLSAAPSAAQTGTVTGGTITVNLTPTLTETLGTGTSTDPNCSSTLSIDVTTYAASGTSTGHTNIAIRSPFVYSSGNYYLQLNFSSSTYTMTHTAGSDYTSTKTAFTVTDVMVYAATGLDSCTGTTAKCSNIDAAFTAGLNGTFTGTVSGTTAPYTLTGTAHLAGVAAIAAAGCTPPFSALNGKTATISSMTVAL